MIRNLKNLFNITASLVIGSLILWNCEPDADKLGSQFFQNGAEGVQTSYSVIAYTINHNDTIRTDAIRLQRASIGAFTEPQFGLQKAAFVTQARLSQYAPDFGTNPVLDSAVLVIKPDFASDSVTTTSKEDYIYPDGAVPAKLEQNTYPITKYGKTKINGKTVFHLKVHRVTDYLGGNSDKVFSNRNAATSTLLGSTTFDGDISSVKITKDSDKSTIFERGAGIAVKLDSTFFQDNIIKKGNAPELADAASFIRYFRGMKISVDENDGYLFKIDPNALELTLYYKKDKDGSSTPPTRESDTFTFDLGTSNAHFSEIINNKVGSALETYPAVDTIVGSPRVYAQGMGGPGIGLKIPQETIAGIKELYKNEKVGIISAKIRIYTDPAVWNNKYQKPDYFTVNLRKINTDHTFTDLLTFLEDMNTLAYSANYSLVKGFNLDQEQAYYDIGITQTLKNIIEKEEKSRHYALNVGKYNLDANGQLIGWQYKDYAQYFNTRSHTPYRAVFIGTDAQNPKGVQLLVSYGKK